MIPDPNSRLFARLIKPELRLGLGLSFGSGSRGRTFQIYVDSVNGNDSNNGAAINTAYKTLAAAKVAALVRGSGVGIAFVRGSSWREDFDISTLNYVTIADAGYVADPMPIIDGSVIIANASFTKTAGYTNIYEYSYTQTYTEGYPSWWEDGVMMQFVGTVGQTLATNLTALDAAPGSFHLADDGTGSGLSSAGAKKMYIHAGGSSDPTANGKLYEMTDPTRGGQLYVGTGAFLRKIHGRRNMHSAGSIQTGHDARVEGCVFEDGVKHNSLVASGSYYRCVAWKGENGVRTASIMMEFYAAQGSGKNVLWDTCICVGTAPADTTRGVNGFGGHNSTPGTEYSTITVRDCTGYKLSTAFSLAANNLVVERLYAKDCLIPVALNSYVGPTVIVKDLWIHSETMQLHRGIYAQQVADLIVDGLRLYVDNASAITGTQKFGVFPTAGSTVTIKRSALHFANFPTSQNYSVIGGSASDVGITFTGNQLHNATGKDTLFLWTTNGTVAHLNAANNNSYFTDAQVNSTTAGVAYGNVTNYFAGVRPTFESASVIANPLFVSPSTGNFNATAPGLPANSGLVRPNITYTPIPATLADALAWADQ